MGRPFEFEIEPFAFEAESDEEVWADESGFGRTGQSRQEPEYIRWLQQSLNRLLGLRLAIDGIAGPQTRSAIRRFQLMAGLEADGIAGPKTEQALVRAGAGNPPAPRTHGRPACRLQSPASGGMLRSNAARIAMEELLRWGNGQVKESDPSISPVLEDYWITGVGYLPPDWRNLAWSAAFISWVMCKAGAGSAFRYSARHTDYVAAAKHNRLQNNANPFKAYRINEAAPRVGDIVCLERQNRAGRWSGVSYDNVDDGNFRESHSDIVVRVEPGKLITVGGNVSNSVGKKGVTVDTQGRITMPRYYAVIRVGA